jgi:hypothetical protein
MTLTGKDAKDFVDKIRREEDAKRAEALARRKEEAAERGKEPFDLAKLETMCAIDALGHMTPEERFSNLEYMYYVNSPKLMTLAEFAEKLDAFTRY